MLNKYKDYKRPKGLWNKDKRFMKYLQVERRYLLRHFMYATLCLSIITGLIFVVKSDVDDWVYPACGIIIFVCGCESIVRFVGIVLCSRNLLMNRRRRQEKFYREINGIN